ncbi:diguanylate cyclase domain-containing protein [Streptomyces sp. NPDC058864]
MNHDDRPDRSHPVERLLAALGEDGPGFTDAELDDGFASVMSALDDLSPPDQEALDVLAVGAELGHDALALGIEHLERDDLQRAAHWLRIAADYHVPGVERLLHRLRQLSEGVRPDPVRMIPDPEERFGASPGSLARLHEAIAKLHAAQSLAETLQTVADGLISGLDYGLGGVNLVRPDGNLVIAAIGGSEAAEALMIGRAGPREQWDRRLSMGQEWGSLRFISHEIGWTLDGDGVPSWTGGGPAPQSPEHWHPEDRLIAPMYGTDGELLGVLSVDSPRDGLLPDVWDREALEMFTFHAAVAISNARLRADTQRTLVRLEYERQALTAGGYNLQPTIEDAPRGVAVAEIGEGRRGKLSRVNDTLCDLLGRPAISLSDFSFEDLVHPEDLDLLLRMPSDAGQAEVRLSHRDGSYIPVLLSTSVVTHGTEASCYRLTYVDDLSPQAQSATVDELTGLANGTELRRRLTEACQMPHDDHAEARTAVLVCGLNDFAAVTSRLGREPANIVLREVAGRLQRAVRSGDIVARLGDEEFAVLASDCTRKGSQELIARLNASLAPPIRLGKGAVRVGASFGVGWVTQGASPDRILHSADQEMYFQQTLWKTTCLARVHAG